MDQSLFILGRRQLSRTPTDAAKTARIIRLAESSRNWRRRPSAPPPYPLLEPQLTRGWGHAARLRQELVMNILHDLYYNLGYHLDLRDGQLVAVGTGKARLPDEHRQWIASHKEELLAALQLRNNPNCCWICGATGVAEIRASHRELDAEGPLWYCDIHIPNTDVREAVALAMLQYRRAEQLSGEAYHIARDGLIRAQVRQDLAENIVNPWGWDLSWLPSQLSLDLAA